MLIRVRSKPIIIAIDHEYQTNMGSICHNNLKGTVCD